MPPKQVLVHLSDRTRMRPVTLQATTLPQVAHQPDARISVIFSVEDIVLYNLFPAMAGIAGAQAPSLLTARLWYNRSAH